MKLDADAQGFLIGVSVAGADGAKLLKDIKGDTGRILAVMLKGGRLVGRGQAAVEPARRSMSGPARDAAGRFVAAPALSTPASRSGGSTGARGPAASASAAAARPADAVASVAVAVEGLARAQELQRREAKADARAQARGKDGRFGSDGRGGGGGGGGGGGFGSAVGDGIGRAAEGLERVDPMLEAVNELRGIASVAGAVVSPVGRSIRGILGGRGGAESDDSPRGPTGLLRRLWREIRGMRKEQAQGDKALVRSIKDMPAASGGGGIGGLLGMVGVGGLGALLALALPMIAVAGKVLAVVGAGIAGYKMGSALYDKYATKIQDGIARIGQTWDTFTGYLSGKWDAGMQMLTDTFNPARKWLDAMGDWVMNLPGMKKAKEFFAPKVEEARDRATDAALRVQGAGRDAASWAKTKMGAAWNSVKDSLVGAAVSAGVDPGLVAKIAGYESGFNPSAMPVMRDGTKLSSAHGLGQFLDGTWVDTVRKHGEKYGVQGAGNMSKADILRLRGNVGLQAKMLAEYTKENMEIGRRLGGSNDDANIYALHNLGAGDGSKFLKSLKANPNARVSDVLSARVINNNKSLYGDGSITVQDAYGNMGAAMQRSEAFAIDARAIAGGVSLAQAAGVGSPALNAPVALGMPSMPAVASSSTPAAFTLAAPSMPRVPDAPMQPAEPASVRLNSPAPPPVAAAPAPMPSQDVPDRNIAHIVSGGLGSGGFAHR